MSSTQIVLYSIFLMILFFVFRDTDDDDDRDGGMMIPSLQSNP